MLSPSDIGRQQREQHRHDLRNHFEIYSRSKLDRLKHYGLHFAKYVGRLARGADELKAIERTLVDTALVSLSTANTLHQDWEKEQITFDLCFENQIDQLRVFADAAGRFADACEKIDHLEEFQAIARTSNSDILSWVVTSSEELQFPLLEGLRARRLELSARHFYIDT
jgi:hypothetical protein